MLPYFQDIQGPTWVLLSHQIIRKLGTDAKQTTPLKNVPIKKNKYVRKLYGDSKNIETTLPSPDKRIRDCGSYIRIL